MNENQPSTVPWVSGVGSNWTGTTLILDASRPAALMKASQVEVLETWTPIFLPYMPFASRIGDEAIDMIANGFFWYCAPMICSGAPFWIAAPVMSGEETPTRALPEATSASIGVAEAPPAIRFTELNPCAL